MGSNDTVEAGKAKRDLVLMASDLMPSGKPEFKSIVYYQTLKSIMSKHGKAPIHMVLQLLIADFCKAFNVVRNMNEDQMIEAAAMLMDECGDFRLEDYVIMFTLAKRGELVDIRDRVDLQMIGKMLDAYWKKRHEAGLKIQEAHYQEYERSTKNNNSGFSNMALRGFLGWGVLKKAYSHNFHLMVSKATGQWKQEVSEEKQNEEMDRRRRVAESYALLQGVNFEAILEEFSNKK